MTLRKKHAALAGLRSVLSTFGIFVGSAVATGDESLHARIDSLITAGHTLAVASNCSDAQFLRRAFLDLAGTIPSSTEARAFLDDHAPDKRATCVDRLLAGPRFARNMAQIFDVVLMERRADKHIPSSEWLSYLHEFFDDDRPLDQLFDEMLSADGVDPERRPAARFLLDRDADSHVLARDVGRIAFGRDLQCAQCHDHPLIDDYHQRDYFALLAFFTGTKVLTTNDKKVTLTNESGGGASYRSVFDSSAKGTAYPRVPGGKQIDMSKVTESADTGLSTKNGEPGTKTSLRGQLAFEVRHSRQFARNLANRLWAMLMGRGLTDPVDLGHSENTPVHPQLLELLTDELLARQFRPKSLVREIVFTQAYQRATEVPADLKSFAVAASAQIPQLIQQRDHLAEASATSAAAVATVREELSNAQQQAGSLGETLQSCEAAVASTRSASDEANKLCHSIDIKQQDTRLKAQAVAEAAAKAEAAAALLPSEPDLAAASQRFRARAKNFEVELVDISSEVTRAEAANRAAKERLTAAQFALDDVSAKLKETQSHIIDLEPNCDRTVERSTYDTSVLRLLDSRLAAANALSGLASELVDPELVVKTREDLTRRWRREWLICSLRPLSPEQFAWSAMKAAGVIDAELAVATAEVDRTMPRSEALVTDAATRGKQIEQHVFAKLSKNVERFAKLYGAPSGQPQHEFFATADQALYFTNSSEIWSWLAPKGDNLTARLLKINDRKALAEELYLTIYTRRPSEEEAAMVFDYLKERGADRTEHQAERSCALRELVWGMLASAEFRFIQ